jgi:hypothetical protein
MTGHIKTFEVPAHELRTEGVGTDPDKLDYAAARFLEEARQADQAFEGKVIENCWHGVSSESSELIPEALEGSEGPFDFVERFCELSNDPDDCSDIKELIERNFHDEEWAADEGGALACGADAYIPNDEGKSFEQKTFEFEGYPAPELIRRIAELPKTERGAMRDDFADLVVDWTDIRRAGATEFALSGCRGKNGEDLGVVWGDPEGPEDRQVMDLLEWHNFADSESCKRPLLGLPGDDTVWLGEKTTERRVPEFYSRISIFTWD